MGRSRPYEFAIAVQNGSVHQLQSSFTSSMACILTMGIQLLQSGISGGLFGYFLFLSLALTFGRNKDN